MTDYLKDLPEKDVKRVWAEPVGKFKNDAMLYCEEGWGRQTQEVDARGMSDGTLRYLAIVTALLDAAGNIMVPFITVVHRDDKSGASILTSLEEIGQLPKLMVGGSLGKLSSEGRIETALKMEAVA